MIDFLLAAENWVLLSFIVFVVLLGRKIWGALASMLDKRAEEVREKLDEAEKLREEAQNTLAQYQRKQREALKEAEEILDDARNQAVRMKEKAQKDLEDSIARRKAMAETRIAQAEAEAVREVSNKAVGLAIKATEQLLQSNLDVAKQNAMIEKTIADLPAQLN